MKGYFELSMPTATLMMEIENKAFTRRDVAKTYRLAIVSSNPTDWEQVNAAIVKRWSPSALLFIKRLAWSQKGVA